MTTNRMDIKLGANPPTTLNRVDDKSIDIREYITDITTQANEMKEIKVAVVLPISICIGPRSK